MRKWLSKLSEWFLPKEVKSDPAPEIRIEPCHCLSQVGHVRAASDRELVAWMESLKESSGWRYLMRRAHNDAVKKITRWSTSAIKPDEVDQRNQDVLEAQVVFKLIQSVEECITEAKERMNRRT